MKNPAHPAYSHITEQFRQPPSLPPKLAHPDCRLSERFNFHNIATKGGLRAQVCALRRETRAGSVQSPAPSQACISSGRASRNCRRKADDNGSVTGTGLHPSNSRAAVRTRFSGPIDRSTFLRRRGFQLPRSWLVLSRSGRNWICSIRSTDDASARRAC
jgi:hypothetical protein